MGKKGDDTNSKKRFYTSIQKNPEAVKEYSDFSLDKLHENLILNSLDIANHIHMNWSTKENNEQMHRKKSFKIFIIVFLFQLLVLSVLIFLQGFNVVNLKDNILYAYMTIVFAEIIGIVAITFKYIFSERTINPLEISYKIIDSANKYNNIYFKESLTAIINQQSLKTSDRTQSFMELWEAKKGEINNQ